MTALLKFKLELQMADKATELETAKNTGKPYDEQLKIYKELKELQLQMSRLVTSPNDAGENLPE